VSAENIEVLKRLEAAWNSGDLNGFLHLWDEHAVWVPVPDHPDPQPLVGREGVISFAEQWMEPWDDYEVATERFEEVGDTIVWCTRQTGRRRDSGKGFEVRMAAVCSFRQGRVAQIQWFWDRADALAAVGGADD
jgi:ketosteroid isomerase-like protein